jgi:hypothetical protein
LLYPGGYAESPRRLFSGNAHGYPSQKVLVVVAHGAVVSVAIAPTAFRVASLLYDPSRFKDTNRYEVSEGERAVTFEACASGASRFTQFNGAFIVAGARCVPLQILTEDGDPRIHRVLSFGRGECCSAA